MQFPYWDDGKVKEDVRYKWFYFPKRGAKWRGHDHVKLCQDCSRDFMNSALLVEECHADEVLVLPGIARRRAINRLKGG